MNHEKMMPLYLSRTNTIYELTNEADRIVLREDLRALGFFALKENSGFFEYFTRPIGIEQFHELTQSMVLYMKARWECALVILGKIQ